MRRSLAIGFAITIAMTAAGCATAAASGTGAGQPGLQESPSATPSADPLADAVALVVRPEAIELNDAQGVTVRTISYEAPAAEMVDALSAVIGSDPEVRPHEAGLETPPGVYYEWPGLTVSDPEPVDGTYPGLSNLQLSITAASVGGLDSITTTQGYSVGSETAPILAENDWTVPEFAAFHFPAEFGAELGAASGDNPEHPNAWAVSISAEPPASAITLLFAPVNFGISGH